MPNSNPFNESLNIYQQRIESKLNFFLPPVSSLPKKLHAAMHYAVMGGGKRIRPFLVYAAGNALNASPDQLDAPAVAIELIHAYSLVHDDLPAMDNDDLRRGKPTCHKAFDEATAILVGDALQTLAFEILARADNTVINDHQRLLMIKLLAQASGSLGMVGGQAIDLASVGKKMDQIQLEQMHRYKTGALISASVELGVRGAGCNDNETLARFNDYAQAIGLAFQVRDDILDIEGDSAVTGKTQGSDIERDKPTYPALLGLKNAKKIALGLHEKALDALSHLGQKADTLRGISSYIVNRKN